MRLLIWAAVLGCAYAFDLDTQSIKSVKGGRGGFQYQGGDISRFYNNNNSSQHGGFNSTYGAGGRPGQAPAIDFEVGVCYIEVPISTLVRDPAHIPAGNGSRPDLSRIRTCCKGYTRNVYNFKICEPVCTQECVNALCTAPDTCTCYPDHVRNQAGVCVATCPIGCQNGHCDGGECLCKEGFKLDVDGRFCVPNCRHDCGGAGTCTAPNMCECRPGYEATSDGSCKLSCGKCDFGDCVSPTECRCRPGFQKDGQGQCAPHCSQNCGPNARCTAPNVCSPGHSPGSGPTNQLPNNQQMNSQNPYGPVQNQTSFYNPNHDPYGSLHPYDQNKPQSSQPNSTYPIPGSNYPQSYPQPGSVYPHPNQPQHPSNYPQNPNQPQPGSGYPQPYPIYHNQGSNQPQYPYGQNPQNPQYPSGQNPQNSQYPYGQSPQNPQYPINTNTNQGQFNTQVETVNITYPQYPLYPDSQVRPNGTNQPGQQYPDSQRPNNYPQHGYNPQSPNHGYPTQQHGYYPYNQNPYDQTQESGLCAEPCVNGQCIDHNRCRCNPGYITDEMDPSGNRCRPHCPGGCPNGYCVAPHSCACNEGYYRDTSVKGRAVCIRRIRRSLRELVFKIPDYVDQ